MSVFCNEVSFSVYFNNCCNITVNINTSQTFCSNTVSFLSCLSHTFFTKQFNRFFDVTVCFYKRFFSVHNTGTRFFTQLFYKFSCNFCHFNSPIFFENRRAGLSPALLGNYYLYKLSVVTFYNFNDFFN
ncbi:Uncharacterised protein [Mycobacterium tuberculosis]|nr:Uncharacterised protein [Mycobacterium tuberculosis]